MRREQWEAVAVMLVLYVVLLGVAGSAVWWLFD